jgi:O-antigen ligase
MVLAGSRLSTVECFLLTAIFVVAAFADLPTFLRVGGATGLAVLTVAFLVAGILSLCAAAPTSHGVRAFRWTIAFALWVAVTSAVHGPTSDGIQNLAVLGVFLTLGLVAAREGQRSGSLQNVVLACGRRLAWGSAALYSGNWLLVKFGAPRWVSPRQFALVAILGACVLLCAPGANRKRSLRLAWLLVALVCLSGSRMALATGVFLILALSPLKLNLKRRYGRRAVVFGVMTLGVMLIMAFKVPMFHDRFLGGYKPIKVAGLEIASSGRAAYWQTTVDSWRESPFLGRGAGSASKVIRSNFAGYGAHPLNEYLRLLHDYGIVGAFLFVAGLVSLLRKLWALTRSDGAIEAPIYRAAALATVALMLTMFTDNSIIYLFFMGPLAVLVGTAVGRAAQQDCPR